MLFTSLAFLISFPLFCIVYFSCPARHQLSLVVLASLAFVAAAGWVSVAGVLLLTAVAFRCGRWLAQTPTARALAISVVALAAPLVALKYTSFALSSIESGLRLVGFTVCVPHPTLPQPLGLSFYTLVAIGYVVDVYLGRVEPEPRVPRLMTFVAFFPKLVSGPVERAGKFLPQLEEPKRFDYVRVTDGIRIMAWGFFKKLVVADRIAPIVDFVYGNASDFRGLTLVAVSLLYMFQVYYDFWAYSDIAVGAARVLGFDLTENFDRPYASRSISDYWRRWHISFASWLFDYIFVPLAAAKRHWGRAGVVVGLMVTFLVSGLWHGAQWTFIVFGLLHGLVLSAEHLTARPRKRLKKRVPARAYAFCAWAATFSFLACVDVFFRAPTVASALAYLRAMGAYIVPDLQFLVGRRFSVPAMKTIIAGFPVLKTEFAIAIFGIALVELLSYAGRGERIRLRLARQPTWLRWAVYYAVSAALVFLGAYNATTPFVYMQF